ncbi:amino acid permease-domain-containing protein [Naematelia encephala]|uniref:Amino acid permease-domain-containing protein n=1 Tax=Naematelia encephala TaxID=71784 RepID=A0A1Y2AU68_9TREE|nr:amino acid permease-domain-containing protein [Naematelia encephala]
MSSQEKYKDPELLAPVVSPGGHYSQSYQNFVVEGDLKYIAEQGGNVTQETYQEVHGAPVERQNPLGYHVGWFSASFLNITMLIGTGIFSTPATIFADTGSVGLALLYWPIGLLISLAGISVYLEFLSYFPSRSGAEVVYLEQAYSRPKYFWPIAFAFQTVILSFSSSNLILIATYIFRMADHTPKSWESKGVAIAVGVVVSILPIVSTKWSLKVSNVLGVVKLLTLLLITLAGFVVLGGHTKVTPQKANFEHAFEGTSSNGYTLSNGIVNIIFSYGGYTNSFNLANEIKNPVRTIKRTANGAVILVAILYMTTNIAYFSVLTKEELKSSSQTTATVFFQKLWGAKAARGLTILPILSALSNCLNVIVGHSRMVREVGRQGILPYTKFWVSSWPFGTPVGATVSVWVVAVLVIIIVPAGKAFNFIVALQSYPSQFYLGIMTIGLFIVRRQRKQLNLPRPEYRSWTVAVLFFLASTIFLLVMPWVPPPGGINNSSFGFFYGTSSIVGLSFIVLCGLYYVLWAKLLPKWGGYQLRQTVITLDDGTVSNFLAKIKNEDLEAWDAKHDLSGRSVDIEWRDVEEKETTSA